MLEWMDNKPDADGAVAYDLFGNRLSAKTVCIAEDAVYFVSPKGR